ncbi:MAG: PCRF domain-containing protein, partial [Acholeplasmatales bacterium]|nr:PCRF domain-containing protein [Acholeplasmatales bacterium]
MERYEINKILEKYKVSLISLKDKINIPKLTISLNELSSLMESPDFWSNSIKAKQVSKDYSNLRSIVTEIEELEKNYQNIVDWYSLVEEKTSEWDTLEEDINNFSVSLENFEIKVLLDKEYDNLDAFLELHPGAGGVESMDFAQMLFRMYSRYAKKNNFSVEIIDFTAGDIAGYKSITFKIKGDYAYGNLKSERGVHRLIRLSPFNSGNSRETSFCSCDVYPSVDDNIKIDIKD